MNNKYEENYNAKVNAAEKAIDMHYPKQPVGANPKNPNSFMQPLVSDSSQPTREVPVTEDKVDENKLDPLGLKRKQKLLNAGAQLATQPSDPLVTDRQLIPIPATK